MRESRAFQSMTGFGSKEAKVEPFGTICVELRSTNHKALEIVAHLPEGFLSLEHKIKKEIETQIKRGRVTCVLTLLGGRASRVFINSALVKEYLSSLKNIKRQFQISSGVDLNTLIHLPGVLSLVEDKVYALQIWPRVRQVVYQALNELVSMRQKEGKVLHAFLKSSAEKLSTHLVTIKARVKKAIQDRLAKLKTDEERSNFLKNSDITEEVERLAFHIKNFRDTLRKTEPVGKELDFIAQEMQREANTMAAKSFDMVVSERIIQIKSQIEKIREQVQNAE